MVPEIPQDHSIVEFQVLSLDNIYLIDESWTSTSQFRREYVLPWMDINITVQVDGLGWIAWGRLDLWGHKIIFEESMSYLQKFKHYDGQ